jgi:Tfp pilus assembly protein PilN
MIKVNLMKSRAHAGVGEETFSIGAQPSSGSSLSKSEQIGVVKKFFVVSLATLMLIAYEWYNVDLQAQMARSVNNELKNAERLLQSKKDELKQFADVQEDSKILEDKISILKALSKVRLREVKSLDFLQAITPEAVWFKSVVYKDKVFVLEGYAVTDDALSALIKELESSIYFTDVILMKASEEKQDTGTVKSFQVRANIGEVG